jgi:hypothetical protein
MYRSSSAANAASASAVLQERDHLCAREQVFLHHEAHQVQAEVPRDRGWRRMSGKWNND